MRILAIVDPETAVGFRLAGVETQVYHSLEEAQRLLEATEREKDLGLVLYSEDLWDRLPEPLRVRLQTASRPLYSPVPALSSWQEAGRVERYLADLLRRSVGFQIRIQ